MCLLSDFKNLKNAFYVLTSLKIQKGFLIFKNSILGEKYSNFSTGLIK